jgi:glycosyltransferase involved in cell wall biosynthesis
MLGNGSQAAFLHRIFSEAGLLDQVHFPGQVSQADLPRYYRSADLYISASHSDGTSISLLEAMACGSPVLVSNIPGNQEWIQDGVQGWLFQDGSTEDLAKKIVEAVRLRQHLSQMGQAAHLLAEQRADWKKNIQFLFKAYEMVLSGSKSVNTGIPEAS